MSQAPVIDWTDLTLRRWRRHGHDRLYISVREQQVGFLDNRTGELHLTDDALRSQLEVLLAHHRTEGMAGATRRGCEPLSEADRYRKQRWNEGVARAARQRNTLSEAALWHELERSSPYTWQRELPWGDYRLDFYCAAARLAVEVDGGSHRDRQEYDALRDLWFTTQGVLTVRVPAADVERDVAAVVAAVNRQCIARSGSVERARPVAVAPPRLPLWRRLLLPATRQDDGARPEAPAYRGRRLGKWFTCARCRQELPPSQRSREAPGCCLACARPTIG